MGCQWGAAMNELNRLEIQVKINKERIAELDKIISSMSIERAKRQAEIYSAHAQMLKLKHEGE